MGDRFCHNIYIYIHIHRKYKSRCCWLIFKVEKCSFPLQLLILLWPWKWARVIQIYSWTVKAQLKSSLCKDWKLLLKQYLEREKKMPFDFLPNKEKWLHINWCMPLSTHLTTAWSQSDKLVQTGTTFKHCLSLTFSVHLYSPVTFKRVKVIKLVRTDTHQVILSIMHSVHNAYKEGSFPLWSSFSGTFTFFLTFPLLETVVVFWQHLK